jgi:hypothetical protein
MRRRRGVQVYFRLFFPAALSPTFETWWAPLKGQLDVPSDAGPVLDAISTVALSMLMDRLRSPALLAHALGPGVLVRTPAFPPILSPLCGKQYESRDGRWG